jgi:hypothetical protein
MIAGLKRGWDNLFGLGEAAVTVPPLDGALLANRKLDEAKVRLPLVGVDSFAVDSGNLLASSGEALHFYNPADGWQICNTYEAEIACLVAVAEDVLGVALASGDIVIEGGAYDGRRYRVATEPSCITAIAASDHSLFVAIGSAINAPRDWQRDLLQRCATGSIWRIDLGSGDSRCIADGLAWPAGLVVDGDALTYAEAWKHRLVRINVSGTGLPQVLFDDLPGYPGRIRRAKDGYWLAVFAPRSQLVEFVLREPAYVKRMLDEAPQPYWIAPKLRSGQSFYEPLQGGGVKHFGQLKPWAPTMSAGLCIRLDEAFQPNLSLHSRADGATHGVTDMIEFDGQVFVAARGDDVVVALPLDDLEDAQ